MSDASKKPSHEQIVKLAKSLRDEAKQDDLSKAEHGPREVIKSIGAAIRSQIAEHQADLVKMRSLEVRALKKNLPAPVARTPNVFDHLSKPAAPTVKGEDFIDTKVSNDPKKRLMVGNGKGTVVPSDKASKELPANGSGGEIKKDVLDPSHQKPVAAPSTPALKPAGVPSAAVGDAPGAPKPPQAPGAAPTMHKSELTAFDLGKGDFGMGDGGKVATSPSQLTAAPKVAAPKPQFTWEHFQAAKAKISAAKKPALEGPGVAMPAPPAPAKFGKAEWNGENCPYCKGNLSKCNCN